MTCTCEHPIVASSDDPTDEPAGVPPVSPDEQPDTPDPTAPPDDDDELEALTPDEPDPDPDPDEPDPDDDLSRAVDEIMEAAVIAAAGAMDDRYVGLERRIADIEEAVARMIAEGAQVKGEMPETISTVPALQPVLPNSY